MSENLSAIYYQCVRHIDSLKPHDVGTIYFDYDGIRKWICSRTISQPLMFSFADTPVTAAPLIFQVIGQISNTKSVVKLRNSSGDVTRATFWAESRPDRASHALWGQIPRSLGLISAAADSYLSFSRLFEVDQDSGVMRLRIVWAPEQAGQVSLHV